MTPRQACFPVNGCLLQTEDIQKEDGRDRRLSRPSLGHCECGHYRLPVKSIASDWAESAGFTPQVGYTTQGFQPCGATRV
jgi:hypothetical protein